MQNYSRGKFRMKQWGKVKIKYELKQKQVSEYNIKKAMKEIGDDDYRLILDKLFSQKCTELKSEKNILIKKRKATGLSYSKGI